MSNIADYKIHKSEDRGGGDYGWLKTKHAFSFAHYFNPYRRGFGALRVINEDLIAGNSGFEMHPHRDMEIVSYVREGTLSHKDSVGNSGDITTGIVQRMSAGKGVIHSEKNMKDDRVHLFQMWIDTKENNINPSYEEFHLDFENRQNKLLPIASGYGDTSGKALYIHQNAEILLGNLDPKAQQHHRLRNKQHGAYVQVIDGEVEVNGHLLGTGDAIEAVSAEKLKFRAKDNEVEYLLFDVPLDNYLDPTSPE